MFVFKRVEVCLEYVMLYVLCIYYVICYVICYMLYVKLSVYKGEGEENQPRGTHLRPAGVRGCGWDPLTVSGHHSAGGKGVKGEGLGKGMGTRNVRMLREDCGMMSGLSEGAWG